MTVGHVMGIPLEETLLQLAPAGAATLTAFTLVARATLGRLVTRLRSR